LQNCRRKGEIFQTLQAETERAWKEFLIGNGKEVLIYPFQSFPKTLPKFVYSNEELGPKCNQRHLLQPKSQF